ncbi:hypothetical protein C0J52_18482, partial [Blattella germanica]
KGGKNRRRGKNENETEKRELVFKEDGQAEKAECVLWLAEFKSVKRVQRRFQTDKGRNTPARNSILHWHKQFRETGTVESQQGKAKKSRISDDDIERVRTAFARSPSKSIREAARQLQMPKSTVHDVVHKRLRLAIQPNDRPQYAQVTKMLGNGRLEAMCFDGVKRLCHIPRNLKTYGEFPDTVRINDTVTFVDDGLDEDIEFGDDVSDEGEGDPVDNVSKLNQPILTIYLF